MKTTESPTVLAIALLASALTYTSNAQAASYYIRPYTISGPAGVIDGLDQDGAFSDSQGFSNASISNRAGVDLNNGELKAYAAINSSTGYSLALAEYSDTLTIHSSTASNFEFAFSYDGTIIGDGKSVPEGSTYQIFAYADFAIFRPGEAAWNTWYDLANAGNALFYDFERTNLNDSLNDIDDSIGRSFSFGTTLEQGRNSYQFFARMQIGVNANTPQTVELDFENTGTFDFSGDPDVDVYSASGVLPNTLPIPEPSGAILTGLAGCLALFRRNRNF